MGQTTTIDRHLSSCMILSKLEGTSVDYRLMKSSYEKEHIILIPITKHFLHATKEQFEKTIGAFGEDLKMRSNLHALAYYLGKEYFSSEYFIWAKTLDGCWVAFYIHEDIDPKEETHEQWKILDESLPHHVPICVGTKNKAWRENLEEYIGKDRHIVYFDGEMENQLVAQASYTEFAIHRGNSAQDKIASITIRPRG